MSLKGDICHHDAPKQLAGAALVHHADSSLVCEPRRVGMMHEYSTGELLATAAFVHHDNKRHDALKHSAALKELAGAASACII